MIVEEKFVSDNGEEEIEVGARIKNMGFREKNKLRSKYVEPKLSMRGNNMEIKDIPVNAFEMVQEAMTFAVSTVTINGTWTDEDDEGVEFKKTFKNEKIKIATDEDWDKIPEVVSTWLFSVVMEKLFRTQGQIATVANGGTRVEPQDPISEGVQPQLRGDGQPPGPDGDEAPE